MLETVRHPFGQSNDEAFRAVKPQREILRTDAFNESPPGSPPNPVGGDITLYDEPDVEGYSLPHDAEVEIKLSDKTLAEYTGRNPNELSDETVSMLTKLYCETLQEPYER